MIVLPLSVVVPIFAVPCAIVVSVSVSVVPYFLFPLSAISVLSPVLVLSPIVIYTVVCFVGESYNK